jgi:hypothetical protein
VGVINARQLPQPASVPKPRVFQTVFDYLIGDYFLEIRRRLGENKQIGREII